MNVVIVLIAVLFLSYSIWNIVDHLNRHDHMSDFHIKLMVSSIMLSVIVMLIGIGKLL